MAKQKKRLARKNDVQNEEIKTLDRSIEHLQNICEMQKARINRDCERLKYVARKYYDMREQYVDKRDRAELLANKLVDTAEKSDLNLIDEECKLCNEKPNILISVCIYGHMLCRECLVNLLSKAEAGNNIVCPFERSQIYGHLIEYNVSQN
jgi:hypothetical protein